MNVILEYLVISSVKNERKNVFLCCIYSCLVNDCFLW